MKRFPPIDRHPLWELWTRPEQTGGRWSFDTRGTYRELLAAMDRPKPVKVEYSIRRADVAATGSANV